MYIQKRRRRKFTRYNWASGNRMISSHNLLHLILMKLLQLEVGDPTSTGQKNVEKICWRKGRSILNLSRTKCPVRLIDLLNQSHGPNSAFRNLNLEVQKLLKTTHHLLTSLQDWADTTRTRILGSMRKCRISELLQISKGQHRWTSKCTFH